MAKTQSLDGKDLAPAKPLTQSVTRQRGVVPSAELVPLQFKMPPDFVQEFKLAALQHKMKLNEFLLYCFNEKMKSAKHSG